MNANTNAGRKQITSPNLRLIGWRLKLMWLFWIATACLVILALSGSIPQFIKEARHGGPYTQYIIQNGISPSIYFPLDFALNILQLASWYLVALFIVIKRSDDWMALIVSIMILANGYFVASFDNVVLQGIAAPQLAFFDNLTWILDIINYGSVLMFYGSFPDGKFVPRWIKPVFLCLFTYVAVEDLTILISPNLTHYSVFSTFVRFVVICSLLIFAQLYRLRHISAVQRQQTKLAVIGLIAGVVGNVIDKLFLLQFGQTSYLIVRPIVFVLYICAAICFGYAILRYHLWDIDFVINRSLVYGGLTILLGAIFVGGFFALRFFFEVAVGNQHETIVVSVLAIGITALFSPTRNQLRGIVDRRFYGIEIDYKKAIQEKAWRQKQIGGVIDVRTSFGPYTGLELIGRGGMGEVYRAQSPAMHNYVVIKILSKSLIEDEVASQRYKHEAQAIAQLNHPNIVSMYDYGILDGVPYIVLEYIKGRTLDEEIKLQGRLSLTEAIPLLMEVALALDCSHSAGIIHRDIKPSNVMIESISGPEKGKSTRAVLMDFGIAKLQSSMTQLTGTGVLVGTLDYVSPEQIQGASEADTQSDIYSFGVMTYQVLTGKLPFEHKNPAALMMAHLMQPAPDPRERSPDLPASVAEAIMRAMAKEPHKRQKTAVDFINEMMKVETTSI